MAGEASKEGALLPTVKGLVSVIVPTFNRSRQVAEAVRSALDQSYSFLEVIVILDGSPDETRAAVAAIDDSRVRHVWQENAGLPVSRNTGMAKAQGEFIAFLDDDDTWLPWKLEAQLTVFGAYPSVGMIWTEMSAVNPGGYVLHDHYLKMTYSAYRYLDLDRDFAESRPLAQLWPGCPADLAIRRCYVGDVYPWMFMGNLAPDSTVILRRDRQEATGRFDPAFVHGYPYFLRACEHGDVAFLDAASVRYQIGAKDKLSGPGKRAGLARSELVAIERALSSPASGRLPQAFVRERLAICHSWIGAEEFLQDRRSARSHLAFVLKSRPLLNREMGRRALYLFGLTFLPVTVYLRLRQARGAVRRLLAKLRADGS
jgi:hypothetical protein